MTAASRPLPEAIADSRSTGWWAMVLVIASEATLFAAFLGSYFYLLSGSPEWPPDGIEPPKLTIPIIATVLLLGSSVPMLLADARIRRDDRRGMQLALALSFVMAAVFVALQIREYRHETFHIKTNSYGSLFYSITGLHGLHVITALAMNAYLQLRAFRGHVSERKRLSVTVVGMYWHFVDVVWIFIFVSLYLSPRWLP
jgi:heme/copper-type cytochrome/quinol oxidase subunit 3